MSRLLHFCRASCCSVAMLAVALATCRGSLAGEVTYPVTLAAPDGKLKITLRSPEAAGNGLPLLDVSSGDVPLLRGCELGLTLAEEPEFFRGLRLEEVRFDTIDETYRLPGGKSNPKRNHCRQATLRFQGPLPERRRLDLEVRAYNDGLAFRYVIPKQKGLDKVRLAEERTVFRVEGNPAVWPLFHRRSATCREGNYRTMRFAQLAKHQDLLIDTPLLMQWDNGIGLALTEARLRNYAGMFLQAQAASGRVELRSRLAPIPDRKRPKVVTELPLVSPWRVVMVGDPPGRLMESNLIVNLNDPNAIGDTSWIRFGKTTWHWWNGTAQEPVGFTVGLDYRTMAHYVDFCAQSGIAFHALVGSSSDQPWYQQGKRGFGPVEDTNILAARPELEMDRLLQYAKSKGVGIRLWVHWKALSDKLEEAFALYEKWGITGLMVDFLDRDDQEMVLFCEKVLKTAARHHLRIQFHGVGKPTGLRRTYPNLANHEGVLNLEYLKWGKLCTPDHNVTVPFTRMLAGPMDYHLGGFRNVSPAKFKVRWQNPLVLGSRCHHLAMYVVYENPVPMVCDTPTTYRGQPGFEFIKQVPTYWDETRFVLGEVGQYVVVARRSGDQWYVGCMTGQAARDLEIPLSFLPEGRFEARILADDPARPDELSQVRRDRRIVTAETRLSAKLLPCGGQVIHLVPLRPSP